MEESSEATGGERESRASEGTAVPYWEDPVCRYVSRRHRLAAANGDSAESKRLEGLMQALADGSMPDALHEQLRAEAKADKKKRGQDRKRQRKSPPARASRINRAASVNVAELKKRIFNPQVSRENVIKALEALPPAERKATIAGLPPGLRHKLESYLKGRGS